MVFFRTSNGSFTILHNDNYFEIRIQSTSNEKQRIKESEFKSLKFNPCHRTSWRNEQTKSVFKRNIRHIKNVITVEPVLDGTFISEITVYKGQFHFPH